MKYGCSDEPVNIVNLNHWKNLQRLREITGDSPLTQSHGVNCCDFLELKLQSIHSKFEGCVGVRSQFYSVAGLLRIGRNKCCMKLVHALIQLSVNIFIHFVVAILLKTDILHAL